MELIYYTERGLPPFMASHSFSNLQISFAQFYQCEAILHKIPIRDFAVLGSANTFLNIGNIMDSKLSIEGSTNPDFVKITVPESKQICPKDYMKFGELIQADTIVALSEEASMSAGSHKAKRSARNSVQLAEKCLAYKRPETRLLGNIQGGGSLGTRQWCTKRMKKLEVDGFMIGGMKENDWGQKVRRVVERVTWELKDDERPIGLSGPGKPLDIVHAAMHGVNIFETCWPFYLAEEGKALCLPVEIIELSDRPVWDGEYKEIEIDLKDSVHAGEKGSIVENCECFTCENHHRGYIHHLLNVKEMNAQTLLAIHNTYTYEKLIGALEKAKEDGNLESFHSGFIENFCEEILNTN